MNGVTKSARPGTSVRNPIASPVANVNTCGQYSAGEARPTVSKMPTPISPASAGAANTAIDAYQITSRNSPNGSRARTTWRRTNAALPYTTIICTPNSSS